MALDFESIKGWIVATLDPNDGVRQASEANLKNVGQIPVLCVP